MTMASAVKTSKIPIIDRLEGNAVVIVVKLVVDPRTLRSILGVDIVNGNRSVGARYQGDVLPIIGIGASDARAADKKTKHIVISRA